MVVVVLVVVVVVMVVVVLVVDVLRVTYFYFEVGILCSMEAFIIEFDIYQLMNFSIQSCISLQR